MIAALLGAERVDREGWEKRRDTWRETETKNKNKQKLLKSNKRVRNRDEKIK